MIDSLRAAISFLSTIPAGGDFEAFRRNLWVMPYAGVIIGAVIAIPLLLPPSFRLLALPLYIAVEGINHIDGLADFGDAVFAPGNRKREALKDLRVGAGGIVFVATYLILLFHLLSRANPLSVIFSQMLAKHSMLLLLVTSKPAWPGMAAEMMRHARSKDLLFGSLPLLFVAVKPSLIFAVASAVLLALAIAEYGERHFSGVSGDLLGATNCIVFTAALILSLASQ